MGLLFLESFFEENPYHPKMEAAKIKVFIDQFFKTLLLHRSAIDFIKKHRLWQGVAQYGWVSKVLVFIAFIIGLKVLSLLFNWLQHTNFSNPFSAVSQMGSLYTDFAIQSYKFLFFGSLKYVMLALLEVVIFHFSRKTIEILTGKTEEMSFRNFFKAQTRMLFVVGRSYIAFAIVAMIIRTLIDVISIFPIPLVPEILNVLKPVLIFGVHCYYIGFAILDNYHEQFGLGIKESVKYSKQFVGVAVAAGLILSVLVLIPFFGIIIAPILTTVAVCLMMYQNSNLHILGKQAVDFQEIDETV